MACMRGHKINFGSTEFYFSLAHTGKNSNLIVVSVCKISERSEAELKNIPETAFSHGESGVLAFSISANEC